MWIKNYILTIISVVLLSTIIETLMPDTSMKKHISLVAGLIVLFAIAKPIVSIHRLPMEDVIFRLDDLSKSTSKELYNRISQSQNVIIDNTFAGALSGTISNAIKSTFGIECNTKAVVDNGTVKYVKFNCKENSEVQKFIKQMYGLECIFEKDDG